MFRSENKYPEHILVYGPPKSSKTRSWASIVEHSLDQDITFHVLDIDRRAPQSLSHIENWEKVVNLSQPHNWDELWESTEKATSSMSPFDWLVIDQGSHPWQFAISYYIEQVMGKKPYNFFLDFKKGGGKGNPLAGGYGENWNIINSIYKQWMLDMVLRAPGHIFIVTQAEPINMGEGMQDDVNIRKFFGRFGVKPVGQKELGFQMDTVLLTGYGKRPNEFMLSSVGDTNRELVSDIPLFDFAIDYLVKVGNWKL